MQYLYHYFERGREPFQNISAIPIEEAKAVLRHLRQMNPAFADLKDDLTIAWFLRRRKELEELARNLFRQKGGRPLLAVPHYLSFGPSEYLKGWYMEPAFIKIPLQEFALDTLSFCYGDIFPTFSSKYDDGKEYQRQIYTYDEIMEIIARYGRPEEWNADGAHGPERYIEVHAWSDDPIERYVKKGLRMRRYSRADQEVVWELHNLALHQVGAHVGNGPWDADFQDIHRVYINSGGEFLVGEVGGQLVAMGAIRPTSRTHAEVKRMRVHPDYQRQGYGQAILTELEATAKRLGFEVLHLDTTTKQVAAQRFYEKNGFVRTGMRRYAGFDYLLYEKRLKDTR
ncbi:MAG TPA: GNAT family N-acetyltransferase [Firmicutes bacterium]|nr:GNAT family N-acetyltransferase [Bacillota bacterium]